MKNKFVQAAVRGVFWTYSSFYIGKLMVFISTVILARLLSQSDFGVVSFAMLFIGFLDTINSAGISSALIYYQNDEEATYSAFWLDIVIGAFMVLGTWLAAPFVGEYFDDVRVVDFVRVLSIVFFIDSLEDVPKVLLTRNLSFNVKFIPDTLQSVVKGLTSILFAVLGFGAWSLVIGQISGALVSMVTFWIIVPWRPKLVLSIKWLRSIFAYGGGVVASNILSYILVNIDYLFVGYYLGAASLGVYTIAFRIPELLIVQFCSLVGKVIFPVYAKIKNESDVLNKAFLITMNYVSLVTVPIGLGLMLIAEPFVIAVFTDKWSEAIPVMRAISLYALFLSLGYNANHVYKAQGEISIMTTISTVRAVLLIPALWWATSQFKNIEMVGWIHAVIAFIAGIINLIVASRLLKISPISIFITLRSSIVAGIFMAIVVLGVLHFTVAFSPWIQLFISIVSGAASYAAILSWVQKGVFREAWVTLQSSLSSGKKQTE
ncbi:MAG: lipopolysaccharide biosynthesis protein [Anaerolineales bacterium]|nr:lipopolysaccharide biosynthesis protein [Anaerolineales bacterium]